MHKQTETASLQYQCGVCSKSFKTTQAIANHSLGTGHKADQCCRPCLRLFGSLQALEQHRSSPVHANSPASAAPNCRLGRGRNSGIDSSSSYTDKLSWRGNLYSRLSTADQSLIYNMLVFSCHSQDCLREQHYALEADPPGNSGAVEATEWAGSQRLPSPKPDMLLPKRKAVVLDCEMVGVEGGRSEMVSLGAIDLLTGEVLINSLVRPRQPIVDWRSNISGVTPATMSIATARNNVLDGWETARSELWRYVDEDTVLVGQSLFFDLQVLRVVHIKIVDSAILTAEAVFGTYKKIRRMWGLKALCDELLGLRIRNNSVAHDGIEDALATRELVLWCLRHPAELRKWAAKSRKSFWQSKAPRRAKPKRKVAPQVPWRNGGPSDSDGDQSEYESLRWEDVVSYDIWPKSPPDSD